MKITKEIAQQMLQSENELLKKTALEAFPELGMKYPTVKPLFLKTDVSSRFLYF